MSHIALLSLSTMGVAQFHHHYFWTNKCVAPIPITRLQPNHSRRQIAITFGLNAIQYKALLMFLDVFKLASVNIIRILSNFPLFLYEKRLINHSYHEKVVIKKV